MFCTPPNFHCGQSQQSRRWTSCRSQIKGSWKFYVCLRTDAGSHSVQSVVNHRDVVMWGKHGSWWSSGPTRRSCPWCWSCSISWLKRHYQAVLMPRGTFGFWRFDRRCLFKIMRWLSCGCSPASIVLSAQSDPYECYMSENLIFPYINCTQVSELQVNVHYTYIYMYVMSTRGRPIMIWTIIRSNSQHFRDYWNLYFFSGCW